MAKVGQSQCLEKHCFSPGDLLNHLAIKHGEPEVEGNS